MTDAVTHNGIDRFATWPKGLARGVLALLAVVLILSAIVPIRAGPSDLKLQGFFENLINPIDTAKLKLDPKAAAKEATRDEDLALYRRTIKRIAKGENYYDFIAQEHRQARYPLKPGLSVRLPTMAVIIANIGVPGQIAASIVLTLGLIFAWWRKLSAAPGITPRYRLWAMVCLWLGAALGTNRHFFELHELWAGMLIALAFALHRPEPGGGNWLGTWLAAALALSMRELTLPFVLLIGAYALWRKAWAEAAAWAVLVALFGIGLAWHLSIISSLTLPSDPHGLSWLEMRGLSGWLSNVVLSSNLRFFPHWLAGPILMLAMLGWAGWKSQIGEFGTLLYFGYGVMFMIASRPDNFYWGVMVVPAVLIGAAFAPMALRSLWRAAWPRNGAKIA